MYSIIITFYEHLELICHDQNKVIFHDQVQVIPVQMIWLDQGFKATNVQHSSHPLKWYFFFYFTFTNLHGRLTLLYKKLYGIWYKHHQLAILCSRSDLFPEECYFAIMCNIFMTSCLYGSLTSQPVKLW